MPCNTTMRWLRLAITIFVGPSIACGPDGDASTTDAGTTETGGTTMASATTESTSAASMSGSASSIGTTSDPTTGADTTAGGSEATAATAGATTGIADDCAMYAIQDDCEAAGCTWIGDERMGVCVPDLEPTGGNVCESLGMQQCEALPQCSWDADAAVCNPT
jgi:hypothetical protein